MLVARTAFSAGGGKSKGDAPQIRLDGTRVKFIAGSTVTINSSSSRDTESTLKGLDATVGAISPVEASYEKDQSTGLSYSSVAVPDEFPRGSVMVFATWMDELPTDLDELCAKGAKEAFAELGMVELNVVLYRADGEERDASELDLTLIDLEENTYKTMLLDHSRW